MTRFVEELQALLTGENLCTEEDLARCEVECGEYLDWSCQNCPHIRMEDVSGRALKVRFLRRLQVGGYPFRANDLAMEDWLDLDIAARIDDQARLRAELAPWMKR